MSYYSDGRKYGLRVVDIGDLPMLAIHRNDYETWSWLSDPMPVFPDRQRDWLASLGRDNLYFIGTTYRDTVEVDVALLRLTDIDWVSRTAAVGIDIFKESRGHGHAKPLMRLLCSLAFNEYDLERLWLLVLDENIRAKNVYLDVGFQYEGRMRSHIYRGGKRHDYILMGMLKDEFNTSV